MAGNPFRRANPNRVAESGDIPFGSISTKPRKRVQIQSPPPSPEEIPRRRSSGRISPPPPPPEHHEDDSDSDSTATADSELEQATLNTRRNSGSLQPSTVPVASASGAPFNPFARTLATSEAALGLQHAKDSEEEAIRANGEGPQRVGGSGRPAMDVDAFKNILLTGSAVPSPPVSGPSQPVQDSNSGTDVSSISRQSLFDPYFEMNQETPRTSFDQMEYSSTSDDDEEGSSLMSSSERLDDFAPPAPPKHSNRGTITARGPQTVSFADFEQTIPNVAKATEPPVDSSKSNTLKPHVLHRQPSDLNKPLPPPPEEPARATTSTSNVPASTTTTTETDSHMKKVPPPPPPASRRVGHSTPAQGPGRGSSNAKSNSSTEHDISSTKSAEPTSKPGPVPPPPPSRKSRPISQTATPTTHTPSETPSPAPSTEAKSAPMPPPPPRRNPSKHATGTSANRTPSTSSRSSARTENQYPPNHNAPAPPPPRRGKRESMDAPGNSSRLSSEVERRGSEISVESGKWNPSQPVAQTAEPIEVEQPTSPSSTDILADMNALQAEIDALRAKAGRG